MLPVISGQSCNSGAQTMAVVMRGMVMGDVRSGLRRKIIMKEFTGGLINGAILAVACAGAVMLWDGRWVLALIIGTAMIISIALSTVVGAAVPMIIAATGRDPAQSASIFLSTLTDIIGFLSFLGLAALMMQGL